MDESLQAHLQQQFEAHLGIPSPTRLENTAGASVSPGPANQGHVQKSCSTPANQEPNANSSTAHDSRVEPSIEMLDEMRPTLAALVADCDPASSIQELTTMPREARKQRSRQPLPLQQKLHRTASQAPAAAAAALIHLCHQQPEGCGTAWGSRGWSNQLDLVALLLQQPSAAVADKATADNRNSGFGAQLRASAGMTSV